MQIALQIVSPHIGLMDYQSASIDFLRHVMTATGKKPSVLAKMVGKSPSTFTRPLQEGWKGSIKIETLTELAERTSIALPEDLAALASKEAAASIPTEVLLPIRYEVAASGFLPRDELPQRPYGYQTVSTLPGFAGKPQWLERVISDSMDRMFPQGSLIHVVDAISIRYRARHGDVVVVQRERDGGGLIERTVKQIEIQGDEVRLWPRSHNPMWQSPIVLTDGTSPGENFSVVICARVLRSLQVWE